MQGSKVQHTILLIDDSSADAQLVKRSLSAGPDALRLEIADNGIKALQMLHDASLRATLPDLILLDLNMPRQSGLQTLAKIKADPALKSIPVVILSSSKAECDVSSAYSLHANCYLSKPMDIDGYIEAIRSIEKFWFSSAILPSHHSLAVPFPGSNTKVAPIADGSI